MIYTRKGFTLIELLVVVAIIGMLSSVVLASLSKARAKGRDSARVQSLVQMRNALEVHRTNTGAYPIPATSVYPLYNAGVPVAGGNIQSYCGTPTNPNIFGTGFSPTHMKVLPSASSANACYTYASNGSDYYLKYSNTEIICATASEKASYCDFPSGQAFDSGVTPVTIANPNTFTISVRTPAAAGWYALIP